MKGEKVKGEKVKVLYGVPAVAKIDITLGTVAGCAKVIHETGAYDSLWFMAIYDLDNETLLSWPV